MKSELHLAALALAATGVPVFPCLPLSKKPATEHGFHDATTDMRQIDAWWTENPDYNLAFSPHTAGLSVVDLDGPEAQAEWANLELEHDLAPPTYIVSTPRPNGLHLYFRGELPPTQHALGPHIDTRGRGSYALVPPSRVQLDDGTIGRYTAENNRGVHSAAELPAWIVPRLESLKRTREVANPAAELDQPANIYRATKLLSDYVERGEVAVSGEGGNHRTFVVACEVQNLGVSAETTFKLLLDVWNPACVPPWDDEELETIVQNAARYAQNEAGAWAAGSSAEAFAPILGSLETEAAEGLGRSRRRYKLMSLADLSTLPPPTYLVPDLLPDKRLTMVFGQPGSFKSFIVLHHALSLALAGKRVAYVAGEGARELELRAASWCMLHGHEPSDTEGLFAVVGEMPWAANGDMSKEFLEEVGPFKPDLVIIDTVARAMVGLNENDAKDMGLFVGFADGLRDAMNCAILVVHHAGKDDTRGPRGSQALIGAVDAAVEVKRDGEAVEVWVRRMKDGRERDQIGRAHV